MPLQIMNFEQGGPTGAIPYLSLDNAQLVTLALDEPAVELQHSLIKMVADEAGWIVILCPGQGPLNIESVANIPAILEDGTYYVPPGTYIQFASAKVDA